MRVLLFLLSVVAALIGFAVLVMSKGAIHQIQGFILWLIAAVLFVGAAVIDAMYRIADTRVQKSEPAIARPQSEGVRQAKNVLAWVLVIGLFVFFAVIVWAKFGPGFQDVVH